MNPTEPLVVAQAGLHATGFVAGWLLRDGNESLRKKIRMYKLAMPAGTAIRAAIMEAIGPIPLPPGDRMEFLVESLQTFLTVVNWLEVDRQVSKAS